MTLVRFPPRRAAAIFVCEERDGDGWIVLGPRGGWLHGSLAHPRADARWLARNFGLPVRVTGDAP
jgi:hypothetical protein